MIEFFFIFRAKIRFEILDKVDKVNGSTISQISYLFSTRICNNLILMSERIEKSIIIIIWQ